MIFIAVCFAHLPKENNTSLLLGLKSLNSEYLDFFQLFIPHGLLFVVFIVK